MARRTSATNWCWSNEINSRIVFLAIFLFLIRTEFASALAVHPMKIAPVTQAGPGLELSQVPHFNAFYSNNQIAGRVTNLAPSEYKNYRMGLVVHLEGLGHYSKPFCNALLTPIAADGTWSVLAVTGGADDRADRLIVFLLPATISLGCIQGGDDISAYERAAVSRIDIERDDPYGKTLTWSGIAWAVRNLSVAVDPGRTIFAAENVSVDANGFLHLRTRRNQFGERTGAEIISKSVYGRGRYVVEVQTSANAVPASTVFGAYTWGYTPSNAHRELDFIEFSRFGNASGPNAGVGTQPDNAQNYKHFNLATDQCSRHEMSWEANRVRFLSFDCAGNLVNEFIYNNPMPLLMDEHLRLNFWSLNGSNNPDAEVIVKSIRFIPEASATINLSSADYSNGHGLAGGSIATAFSGGVALATATRAAESLPLPTTLGGTTVRVRDSAGSERLAELLFVSPGQVNYVLPTGLALGVATITITNGNGVSTAGTVRVSRVSPGLFTANASGGGLPAALLLRVLPDGTQSYEPVAAFNSANNRYEPVPIDVSRPGTFYLVLFGTGLRQRQAITTVRALIGDNEAPVEYAGMQGSLVGVDQVNVRLPLNPFGFTGFGEQSVRLVLDGQVSNTVLLTFR